MKLPANTWAAAIDSTGLECLSASGYFVRRRKKIGEPWKQVVYHGYPKLGVMSMIKRLTAATPADTTSNAVI